MLNKVTAVLSYTLVFLLLLFSSCQEANDKMFTKLSSSRTGVKFKNIIKETLDFNVLKYPYFYNGGGIAVGDINNDGLQDIYFTGNLVASRLYLNKGDLEFEEIATPAGVSAAGLWNTGVTMADVNADGWLDIYVSRSGAEDAEKRRNLLFINNQDLTFTEQAAEYGLDDAGYTTQVTFFDYDLDGDLDMYAMNHSTKEFSGYNRLLGAYKDRSVPEIGERLYRNDTMKYVDVTVESGLVSNVLGFGLGTAITDVNQDGWPDIYVGNDFTEEDYLYINQKDGTFKESVKEYFGHVSLYTMGCDAGDINNDMKPDIITLDMLPESSQRQKSFLGHDEYEKHKLLVENGFHEQTMRNMLQLNNGNGTFSEVGQYSGISHTDWSWAPLIADYDNDGWKDLYVTNGYMRNYLDMDFKNYAANNYLAFGAQEIYSEAVEKMPSIKEANYIFKNNGDLTFQNKSDDWGLDYLTMSNGAVYADLDNDGDMDLITNNINEEAHIYRNNSEHITGNAYLKVELRGNDSNTFAIGSTVSVYAKGTSQVQELYPSRGFQSSVDYNLIFGLRQVTNVDSIIIAWPDRSVQKMFNVASNQKITIHKDTTVAAKSPDQKLSSIFVADTTRLGIDHKHIENDYIDFNKDRMLPYGISTSGPSITKGDVNSDGRDDIYIGGAKGNPGKLYLQKIDGTFDSLDSPELYNDFQSEDTSGIFFDADGDNDLDLYVTSGGVDFKSTSEYLQDRLYFNDGSGNFSRSKGLPQMLTSTSSVAVSDIDNDGDMDIFVGGRLVPKQYPTAPRSYLLLNDGKGNYTDVTHTYAESLLNLGMITDAEFVDMNDDGYNDLVIVGQWTGIMVFVNGNGKKFNAMDNAALNNALGWWNTVHAGDFDNDGDNDLVVGNFGGNNQYNPSADKPISLIYDDFDQNGTIDPLLYYYIKGENSFAYSRDELIGQIASLKKKYPDYKSFSKAPPKDFFSDEQFAKAKTLKAVLLKSVYIENKGNTDFVISDLPTECQLTPIYAIESIDLNNDGVLDLIMGGNLSMSRASIGKYDAGIGNILLGDGKGNFETLHAERSGIKVRGDIRDIALLEHEKGKHVLFSINNDSIKVYRLRGKSNLDD